MKLSKIRIKINNNKIEYDSAEVEYKVVDKENISKHLKQKDYRITPKGIFYHGYSHFIKEKEIKTSKKFSMVMRCSNFETYKYNGKKYYENNYDDIRFYCIVDEEQFENVEEIKKMAIKYAIKCLKQETPKVTKEYDRKLEMINKEIVLKKNKINEKINKLMEIKDFK